MLVSYINLAYNRILFKGDSMDMFMIPIMGQPFWLWLTFLGVVFTLLLLDLGVFNKTDHEIGVKESLKLSAFYITIGLLFGGFVWYQLGSVHGINYLTAFLVEKSLSLDNIFVISLVFTYLAIPRKYQHRVLFWGILGVIVLRGIMIGLGATLVAQYYWILYVFGAFLIFTGIKMLFVNDDDGDENIGESKVLKFLKSKIRVTDELHGQKFWVKQEDPKTNKLVWFATPLMLCLLMVEIVDLIFAVDSVPAVFAITTEPFIVYTSNIFAILGLRALYFALAAVLPRFKYLKYAMALVLVFIGSKVFLGDFVFDGKVPAALSLAITIGILAGGVIFSLIKTRGKNESN